MGARPPTCAESEVNPLVADAVAGGPPYVLRLFITGTTSRSSRAIANLRRICEERLAGQYDLQVIDIYQDAQAAERNQIIAAPTLIKALPLPLRRIIGDLADKEKVLAGLGLAPSAAPPI